MIIVLLPLSLALWPLPQNLTQGSPVSLDPCSVPIRVTAQPHLLELVAYFRTQVLHCQAPAQGEYSLTVSLGNLSLLPPSKGNQNYSLNLTGKNWLLKAGYYPGLVRALQTFTQLFEESAGGWQIKLPTLVEDKPDFEWRGVMIDSSRHFLPVSKIMQTIDLMVAYKLNVLHWHICDDDSFPLQVDSVPNLTEAGSFPGQIYSKEQVKTIQDYALRRAVRLVPQIDTPSHSFSWGLAFKGRKDSPVLTCEDDEGPSGQFDPTMDQTYDIVSKVFVEAASLFTDSVIHLGGDEPDYDCWAQRASIKEFMDAQGIKDYPGLAAYYRKRQKQLLQKLLPGRKFMYWGIDQDQPLEKEDPVTWWGFEYQFANNFGNRTNDVVAAYWDRLYLDSGYSGEPKVNTWRVAYESVLNWPGLKGNLLGLQVCLWAELSNPTTHLQKLTPGALAAAERGWNTGVFKGSLTNYSAVVQRLGQHSKRVAQRGLSSTPITNELCERQPELCF